MCDLSWKTIGLGWVQVPIWRRQWQSTPVLLPGKSHRQRSLVGCIPWGREMSDATEQLHFHFPALEKEMATHSSVLAWRIPGMAEPGGLPSMGSHRVGHDWSDLASTAAAAAAASPNLSYMTSAAYLYLKFWYLVTEVNLANTKLNLKDRVLGELEKHSFIALPGKGGHSRLIPPKLCVLTWSG